jgi:hypothetical protein
MRAGAGSGYTDLGDFFQGTKITYTAVDNGYVRVTSAELNDITVLTKAGKRMDEVVVWTYKPNVRDVEPSDPDPTGEIVEVPYKFVIGEVEPITHEGTVKVRK